MEELHDFRWECRGCNDSLPCVILIPDYPGDDCSPPKYCPYNQNEKAVNWEPADEERDEP